MKKMKSFTITVQNFRNSGQGAKIEVFVNEQREVCLQVPHEELVHYRSKIANAGVSFSHPPMESNVIILVLDRIITSFEDVEKLLQDLKISYKKINKMEVEHVL